jgi:uncharacterized membrane protein YedE/YeeE
MEDIPAGVLAALIGLGGGVVLGLAARLGDFCTLGALETAVFGGDQRRVRTWGIAIGVAILAAFALDASGQIALTDLPYHRIAWNPLASIFGGLVFGYGMALAGNCGFGALARFGGGDMRSLVIVVVIGLVGFMAMNGPLAAARVALFPELPSHAVHQGYAHFLADRIGVPPFMVAAFVASGLIAWGLSHEPLRAAPRRIAWGAAVGLAVASAIWGTSSVSDYSFGAIPVEGHTFTAPLGRTLLWLMTSSAGGLSFSVGSVAGVLVGAFLGSMIRGRFRWEACDDPRELGRQVGGAALMGVGGVVAMGCSVGQGLTAFATLAYSAPVTLAAIALGGVVGLRYMIVGYEPPP